MTSSQEPRRSIRLSSRQPPARLASANASDVSHTDSSSPIPVPKKRRRVSSSKKNPSLPVKRSSVVSEQAPRSLASEQPTKREDCALISSQEPDEVKKVKQTDKVEKADKAPNANRSEQISIIYPPQHTNIPFTPPVDPSQIVRLVTWNVASLRSVARSGALNKYLERERPHILCLQETKMTPEAELEFKPVPCYTPYWFHSERKGYSGVAAFIRTDVAGTLKIEKVTRGMTDPTADMEGRVITLFLRNSVCLVNAYVPNAGGKLARLDYRTTVFEPAMRSYLESLASTGYSVVYCGDLNVAHQPLDIHNSKGNAKSAGHTPQEREQFGILLTHPPGWVDVYRMLYPPFSGYTYYSRRFGARLREEGKGWRLDYFVVDQATFDKGVIADCFVRPDIDGSDHYPLVLDLEIGKLADTEEH